MPGEGPRPVANGDPHEAPTGHGVADATARLGLAQSSPAAKPGWQSGIGVTVAAADCDGDGGAHDMSWPASLSVRHGPKAGGVWLADGSCVRGQPLQTTTVVSRMTNPMARSGHRERGGTCGATGDRGSASGGGGNTCRLGFERRAGVPLVASMRAAASAGASTPSNKPAAGSSRVATAPLAGCVAYVASGASRAPLFQRRCRRCAADRGTRRKNVRWGWTTRRTASSHVTY
jgi:hypothetical protein